jgi:hypothetical protein
MGVYVSLDSGTPRQIASNIGWANFIRWLNTLEDVPDLKHLVEHGWDEDLSLVESQLRTALDRFPPEDSTRKIGTGLLRFVAQRGEATVLTINDGMSS